MKAPDFLIAGGQKTASTWLAQNLRRHPQIFMPEREILYFDNKTNYAKGYDWYLSHFADAPDQALIGEKSPGYLTIVQDDGSEKPTVERIYGMNPEIKLLFLLRNPVDRVMSALLHHMWLGRIPPSRDLQEVLFGRFAKASRDWRVMSLSFYGRNLERYLDRFGPGQIRVWIFESDVRRRPVETLKEAALFIGADPSLVPAPSGRKNINVRSCTLLRANRTLPALAPLWKAL
ncbi:MAG TPA: sulfotransferase domain-containing protein, partial [Alphaproteobacteria bacterium]|nr:sulfotransferase domain-containing protein [Alphaproteobacteria bacterium]